jgi:hypothetical protein
MKNEENIIVVVKGLSRIKQEVELFSCPGILAVCRTSHQDGERLRVLSRDFRKQKLTKDLKCDPRESMKLDHMRQIHVWPAVY